jgi:sugar-specific transcriptional regulator TrmB
MLDLTPFGFTPTESASYQALLELGPSSGYAVAKYLSIARANAYQALDALVTKGTATLGSGAPRSYRAVSPGGLLALLTHAEATKLDRLEAQLAALEHGGEPTTVAFSGERRLEELALRTAARASSVRCLGPDGLLRRLVPIWRKRHQDGAATELILLGEPATPFPIPFTTRDADASDHFAGRIPFILLTESATIVGVVDTDISGVWSSDTLLRGLAGAALAALAD